VSDRAVAGRYARALFDVAVREADPAGIGQELAEAAALIEGHEGLRKVFASPAVPAARKRALMAELLARGGGQGQQPLARLLLMLAERDRVPLLPAVVRAYEHRLMEHQEVVGALVTTAVPLSEERAQAIQRSLSEATGKQVTVSTRVDPGILGGAVARIGSIVFDGSVSRQLARLRERLTERV
jgi:F-type H+-transporting ATPase subunit delta